jgi:Glucodextranase, domain B/CarboxypepD_reg-like domain
MQLKHVLSACLITTLTLFTALTAQAEIAAGELTLVSSERVSRTDFNYVFKLNVSNTGSNVTAVSAIVTSSSPNTTIIDGDLSFPDIAAGSAAISSDTFQFRHNRSFLFDPSALSYKFSFTEEQSNPNDKDNDGFTPEEGDCNDGDPAINPNAQSIPNNGIDENCDGNDPIVPPDFSVRITSPASLTTVGASPIQVQGMVDDEDVVLTVNGAQITPDGAGGFTVNVNLKEGHNSIVARAVKGNQDVTDSISVSLDLTPPYVTIESHTAGQKVYSPAITVTGLVNDIVRGTIEGEQAAVSVNGVSASISNRSYAAKNVPLVAGENTIAVTGVDQVGNIGKTMIIVNYVVPEGRRIELAGGQDQTGVINTQLNSPLAVRVLNNALAPVVKSPVVFRVTQGSGAVGAGTANEGRAVVVETDSEGLAKTPFKLGSRVGTANHKVRAKVVGYDDEIVFSLSATGNIGNKISINSGNNQRGAVGQILPEAFVVAVTDDGANAVKNARVLFTVTKGGGQLTGVGSAAFDNSFQVVTDSDGRATAEYKLGFLPGIDAQRITATLLDAPQDGEGKVQLITAGFTATGFVPAAPGLTSISGAVLDNQDKPIPGVTVRVDGSERQDVTDEQGQFKIEQSPVGPVHLIADGSTATVDGEFPSLSYNIVTVAGVDNPLSAPIYMVRLDTEGAVRAGPTDVALTLPSYPGFKLEIARDSVTFPDGSREGLISVTPVNASKVPMAPPNGMQPQFIVTIQPTGTRFDPPARLSLPNVDGHAPGAQVEMYSYDHDLEEFVSIGLGTVSEDSLVVTSNPGVGVIKAGWHCGSQPGGSGCAHNCPVCRDCDGNCNCVPASGDPRVSSFETEGDCKTPACVNGDLKQVAANDPPKDDEKGNCKSIQCENGNPVEKEDKSDETKCTTCGENGPVPKPDGHVPPEDKCIICKGGKETKVPDEDVVKDTYTWAGLAQVIKDINVVLAWAGSDKSIPEVTLSYSNETKKVCCTAQNGAKTKEETDAGTLSFPKWSNEWIPTIPPWSGNYTFKVLGKEIGVKYGVRFDAGFGGSVDISRTKRECQGDNCWGGTVGANLDFGGGPFGSVPNPASAPAECGPDGKKRPCDAIRIQGILKLGVNTQLAVNCEKLTGKIGHNGVTINAELILAEGSWVEVGASRSWVLVPSGDIVPIIDIPLPS